MEHRLAVWTIAPADRTLQDRLVKELRLAEGSDVEAGSAFLPGFIERHNAKFAHAPARPDDRHRAQLTFSFLRQRIMLEENDITRGLVGQYVET
jgi:hypothetical protein